jgi:excisionase family DNA binding protein
MSQKIYLTYREAAELLGVTVGTLYSMVSRRLVPHHRIGRRLVRFNRTELEGWLQRHSVADRREGGNEVA